MEGSTRPTLEQSVADAKKFPVLIAIKKVYAPHVDAMMAANPQLVLSLYTNGTFAKSDEVSTLPDSYFLKDAKGSRIKARDFDLYLMNPASPGWAQTRIDLCRSGMAENDYNSCFLDNLGAAPTTLGYVTSLPINPSTGRAWTTSEWIGSTGALAAKVRSAIAPAKLIGNSLGNGYTYFEDGSKALTGSLDYSMVEIFLRGATAPIDRYPSEDAWRLNLDMVSDASARGKSLLICTKTWTEASDAERQAWERFAYSSFLLVADQKHRFYFSGTQSGTKTTASTLVGTKLGAPKGAFTRLSNGLYSRAFEEGTVLVNPTGASTDSVLGSSHITTSGELTERVTVAPHDGAVLLLP